MLKKTKTKTKSPNQRIFIIKNKIIQSAHGWFIKNIKIKNTQYMGTNSKQYKRVKVIEIMRLHLATTKNKVKERKRVIERIRRNMLCLRLSKDERAIWSLSEANLVQTCCVVLHHFRLSLHSLCFTSQY